MHSELFPKRGDHPRLLVSACFCGFSCRYDGREKITEPFLRLYTLGLALPVCPELSGGLPVPREPAEIFCGRVRTKNGDDVTESFRRGALHALQLAQHYGITSAILKERSPSCGSSFIYDGTFSNTVIKGEGIATSLLRKNGIRVWSEENAPDFLP